MTSPSSDTDSPEEAPREAVIDGPEFRDVFDGWVAGIRELIDSSVVEGGHAWALVGIKRRGAVLARRVWEQLSTAARPLLYGEVDISLYRDDYHLKASQTKVRGTEISFAVDGVCVVLVDDVLYTGRTVRAAMGLILDYGRPRVIQLATFVDRGHRELPILANCVGREIPTAREDRVLVKLKEMEGEDCVELIRER